MLIPAAVIAARNFRLESATPQMRRNSILTLSSILRAASIRDSPVVGVRGSWSTSNSSHMSEYCWPATADGELSNIRREYSASTYHDNHLQTTFLEIRQPHRQNTILGRKLEVSSGANPPDIL
jgi:hypothetical protein